MRIDKLQIPEPREIKTPKFNKKKNELLMDKGLRLSLIIKLANQKSGLFFTVFSRHF